MTLEIPETKYTPRERSDARVLGGYGARSSGGRVRAAGADRLLHADAALLDLRRRVGILPAAVTEVYAVYAIGVLVALLLTGGLSDLIGRRPVMISALLGLIAAEMAFMFAGGLEWLYAARSVQGLATGLLLGATGAALVDLHPRRDGAPGRPGQRHRQRRRHRHRRRSVRSARAVRARSRGHAVRRGRRAGRRRSGNRVDAARDRRSHRPHHADAADAPRPQGAVAHVRPVSAGRDRLVGRRRAVPLARPRHHLRDPGRPEPRDRRPVRVLGLRVRRARPVPAPRRRDAADRGRRGEPAGRRQPDHGRDDHGRLAGRLPGRKRRWSASASAPRSWGRCAHLRHSSPRRTAPA